MSTAADTNPPSSADGVRAVPSGQADGRPERAASGLPLARFEVWGEELVEKTVRSSGNSGRVYLPPDWVGKRVKIIRVE